MIDIINVLLDTDYLRTQFDTHPRDMWAFTVLVFIAGIAIGCALSRLVKWSDRRRAESERKESERKKLRNWVIRLDASAKILLRSLSDKDHEDVTCFTIDDIDDLYAKLSFEDEPAVTFSHIETTNDGRRVYRVRISKFGRQAVDEYGEILEEAKEHDKSFKNTKNPS